MAYGIELNGGGNVFQIGSTRVMSGFKVVSSGSASTIPGTTANTFSADFILIRPSTPASGSKQEVYIKKNTTPWSVVDQTDSALTVDYVIIRSFKDAGNTPSTSGYGIQVFDANGDIAFDSGLIGTDGVTLTSTAEAGTLSGNFLIDTALTTNLSQYVSIETSFFVYNNTEFGFLYANNYTVGSNTRNGIYYTGKFYIDIFGEHYSSYLTNMSQIFTATIGSV